MKIVVCIKQVPATHSVSIDPETKRLVREGVASEMNPFDLYALEQGLLIREALGGQVVALTMGPRMAEKTCREALAIGADDAVLMSDRGFGGSDTWSTSYALSQGIKKMGDVDLVICGKQAIDGDTAQVGPGIAAHLDWPQVTYVSSMDEMTETTVTVRRMNEDGYDVVKLELPAVLTVVKDINQPRVPTLVSVVESRQAEVPVWSVEDVQAEPAYLGLDGSPTRVVSTAPPPPREQETVTISGVPEEVARRMVHELRMRSLV